MRPRCLILGGPTAAGKSEAALAVCEAFDAVLLSADAMQVYRGMDIGTAKPTPEEQQRVVHRGIDLITPEQPFDASAFLTLADDVLAEAPRVVVAGGTSLYLQALVRGLVQTPAVDPSLRTTLEALDDPHAALAEVDPELAARLHPNDRVRIVRGLEVFRQTGTPLSKLQAAHASEPDRVQGSALWLDREDLDERIDQRVERMVEQGYVAEVRALLEAGYHRHLKPMRSLGYRHFGCHILDGLPLADAARMTARDTRRFARKQRNWMRVLAYERVVSGHIDRALRLAEVLWGSRARGAH